MRVLIAVAAVALSAWIGAAAANANPYGSGYTGDPHYNQYPAWAQRAFTPANRR